VLGESKTLASRSDLTPEFAGADKYLPKQFETPLALRTFSSSGVAVVKDKHAEYQFDKRLSWPISFASAILRRAQLGDILGTT